MSGLDAVGMAESKTEILVEIAKEEEQTQVYTFDPLVDGSPRWIMVGVPGHESDAGKGLAPETRFRRSGYHPLFLAELRKPYCSRHDRDRD